MSDINQWKFDELSNSKIIITEQVYYRLCTLIGRTSWIASEHTSTLFGRKLNGSNIWIFDSVNENEDYKNYGTNSTNPYDYAVSVGINQEDEIYSKMKSGNYPAVADIHTHPSGITSNFRFMSEGDKITAKKKSKIIGEKGGTLFSGLIGCDRANGNMSISVVWYNKNDDEFYRIQDIYLRQKTESGDYRDVPFIKYGEVQLLMQNWGFCDTKISDYDKTELANLHRR